jgi:hypothetical protein
MRLRHCRGNSGRVRTEKIRREISMNRRGKDNMTAGMEYEQYCAQYLKRHGFRQVRLTSGSGDQGIDILARRRGIQYGIQCKYYMGSVGNKAVQEAYTGAAFYECDVAAVMTNSEFTPAARELAERTEVLLWDHQEMRVEGVLYHLLRIIGILLMIWGAYALGADWYSRSGQLAFLFTLLLPAAGFLMTFGGKRAALLRAALLFLLGYLLWLADPSGTGHLWTGDRRRAAAALLIAMLLTFWRIRVLKYNRMEMPK